MIDILSHSDDYVFNAGYSLTKSGLGRRVYHNAVKHLQELGYLIKCTKNSGGWYWVICETQDIYHSLVDGGFIQFNQEKNTWNAVIYKLNDAEALERHRITTYGHTKSGHTKSGHTKSGHTISGHIPIIDQPEIDLNNKIEEINIDQPNVNAPEFAYSGEPPKAAIPKNRSAFVEDVSSAAPPQYTQEKNEKVEVPEITPAMKTTYNYWIEKGLTELDFQSFYDRLTATLQNDNIEFGSLDMTTDYIRYAISNTN
jgi:hypothetical protein